MTDDVSCPVQLWDVKSRGPMLDQAVNRANGILLLYDVTMQDSFDNMRRLFSKIRQKINDSKDLVFVLAGNKCDLEDTRKVSYEQGNDTVRGSISIK